MAILKKREIEKLEQANGEELDRMIERLPASVEELSRLFDFIEDSLWEGECDDTPRYAMRFVMDNRLNFPAISSWVQQNGGYCDCKIMEQIAPIWRGIFGDD